jgi:hypothetical protein
VETWKPLPTQWNVLLRWIPSTLRLAADAASLGAALGVETAVVMSAT